MNYIWGGLILISILLGVINGRLNDVINAMLLSVQSAVNIAIALIGIMAFWLGMVYIAKQSGLVEKFSKLISPLLRFIFNDIKKDSPAFSNIALNFSANALGLSNAATPFGIKAMQDLKNEAREAGEDETVATNSMCIFLGMNTAGFQLIPASVIAILIAAKAENPTEIILPVLIVTSVSFIFAIIISKVLARFFKMPKQGQYKARLEKLKNYAEKDIFREISKKENKLKKKKSLKGLKNKGNRGLF